MSTDRKEYQRNYQREYYRRRCTEDPGFRKRRQDQQRVAKRKARAADPEGARRKHHAWYWKHTYGITEQEYAAILEQQSGSCAICRQPPQSPRPLSVDHCHETKVVRGLLCNNCNVAIGHFRDDPVLLQRAQLYLAR